MIFVRFVKIIKIMFMIFEAYIQSVEVKTEVKLGHKQIIPLKKPIEFRMFELEVLKC